MSKGAMLRFEDSLPRLPVPSLQETAKRYLKSVHPLLDKSEFENTKKVVDEFIKRGGQGEKLQSRLIARREEPNTKNWIYEWWNDAAYLTYRDPVVPYVSYFYSFRDDRRRREPAKRAAAIATATLEFKKQVDEGTLEPEYMRKLPISMDSYQWMFNACRIPAPGRDYPVKYPPAENKHFIAVRKNQFFKILHEVNGHQLTTAELQAQFEHVYRHAERVPPIGILTTENRDVWTSAREALLAASPKNKSSLRAIESASFVVCLDDASPVTLAERAHQYWHGDGANRFFDKPLQLIVNDNGTAGFLGEHSMMDGTPTHRLCDTVNALIFGDRLDFSNPSIRSGLPAPQALPFQTSTPELRKEIARARQDFEEVVGAHELEVQAYQGYGKALIKRFRCSPDAYVQMVIQLAYRKMHGVNRPTYESAATRRFALGRTETCRSVSDESVAWCTAMGDPDISREDCERLFRAALKSQGEYIAAASEGKGVDRHLFGLKRLVKEGEELPALFTDPAYAYSGSWYLSTSQLSSEFFNGYGWSQVIDGGYGIAYMINEER